MAQIVKGGLNTNQQRFAEEYCLNGENGRQAYLEVYETESNETAEVNASKLLRKTKVKAWIQQFRDDISGKNELRGAEVIGNLRYSVALGKAKRDPQAVTSASAWLGKAVPNLFTDNINSIDDKPAPIPTHDLESIRQAAKQAIRLKID